MYNFFEGFESYFPPNLITRQEWMKMFAKKLRELMTEQGMNQNDLAAITGIKQSVISRYLSAKVCPTFCSVEKIARALECSVDEFKFVHK